MPLQRVPTLRTPFWGRLVLTGAIAVLLILYVAFKSSGATSTIFWNRGNAETVITPMAASNESRLVGLINRNPWKRIAGNRQGQPRVIPKVVYISVADKKHMPAQSQSPVRSCKKLNPDYKIEVMGDAERSKIVAQHTPSVLAVYSKLKPTERNDFWSYLVGPRIAPTESLQHVHARLVCSTST